MELGEKMLARTLAAGALTCAAAAAGAQPPAQPPTERAAAPALTYQSAFEGYRPYVEAPPASWREVNETVERVGGHVGVLRAETQETSTPPAAAPAAPRKEAGHDAHHRK
jgi:hypothetical protein